MSKIIQGRVKPSTRDGKKFMREVKEVDAKGEIIRHKTVHFGDATMEIKADDPEHRKSYCARSKGIKGADDPFSPNYQSRKKWRCR